MSSDVRKPDATPYGRTLKQYSIDEKLAIITHAKSHGNRAAGREFNVAESSIREWRKNEMKLINNKNSSMMPGIMNNVNNNNNKAQMQKASLPLLNPDLIRYQLAQYAHLMKAMDLSNSPPFPFISPFHQEPQEPVTPTQPSSSDSTTSSVGTPSSVSSASTPPPASSPVPPAGSGRRKLRVPQKIVAQEVQEVQEPDTE